MRIALLSNGPSLSRTFEARTSEPDLRIGVNAACMLYPVDWVCAGDWQTFYECGITPLGTPNLATMAPSMDEIKRQGKLPWMTGIIRPWTDLCIPVCSEPAGWSTWSATAALVLAVTLGARQIDVYGVDMTGRADCRQIPGKGRDEVHRWARERPAWDRTVAWAISQGVEITRHSFRGEGERIAVPC